MQITAYDIAQRFIGCKEVPGTEANPAIMAMLKLDGDWPQDDKVPWCSAFVNRVCWLLRLPRSKSLRARSWLEIGQAINLVDAIAGFDVVILKRGSGVQPGPDVIEAPGHVGFFAGHEVRVNEAGPGKVLILGGNQSDSVSVQAYDERRLLGIRRLLEE